MDDVFVNKVSESGIITLDLEDFYPKDETAVFDMKDHLFMGLILKEKDFREAMKTLDLAPYKDKNVALTCSADAIIPVWAYMLATSFLLLCFAVHATIQRRRNNERVGDFALGAAMPSLEIGRAHV